ncbi:hypothetical protein FHS51_000146 [Sphingobium wenxiniae]|uniref:Uncharacterized protein n=2 Tax=Sphingobium TaxID=165695 RepID=T0GBV2_9SPHN|nr:MULTISPECIES: hypothetical protein [Sphingobium]EQA98131.1 hypothetical protein L485_18825 [Sphingobium baderi LL03]KMS63367.1 hypothetical protein V475_03315 [Sphingobium baderi LL03]MBB6189943.1 hypothetical protein [Sphingobium wenxiniae]TWH97740.1 hypothetical protein IQ35_00339 [Sphingobium wenxiniae]WRD77232.1 hypothetical protein QQ987_03580 [Sphingobium baderi]
MFHSILLLLVAPADAPTQWAQLTIERRVIIRVPMAGKGRAPAPLAPQAKDASREKKGPRCIALRSIRSASIVVANGVDLTLADSHRYRARLERGCNATSFYSGFYVEPDEDGSLCSGRDELQARSGLSCGIDSFKRLVAQDPDE